MIYTVETDGSIAPTETRNVRTISIKNGEIAREILLRISNLARLTVGRAETTTHDPNVKCMRDDLELQNHILCDALERIAELEREMLVDS